MAETWHSKVEKSVDNLLSPDENFFGGREFFYRSRNFCRSNIFHVREFFIDGEFLHRYDREFKIFENDSEFHDRSWSQYWSTVFFGAITQQTNYKGK